MVTKGASEPAALRKMLKPLAEKRRRERINRSLEELRVLLLDRTRQQTLQNRKVEKAEILELAVRYLRDWSTPAGRGRVLQPAGRHPVCVCPRLTPRPLAQHCLPPSLWCECVSAPRMHRTYRPLSPAAPPPPGADPAGEADPLQRCYLLGFRECLLQLSAFLRDTQPCVQGRLLDTLHLYLATKCRQAPPEPSPPEPACRLQPGLPPQPVCPVSPSPSSPPEPRHRPFSRPVGPETSQRHTDEAAALKGEPPQLAVWRPWP
ncbi:transcription factor HES-7-like isoform X2 [Pelodiscus sinensis]|uniref:transcription factor HES-7-like isoform X2 n=1 Tax=Pelodiscus sinensis TaxID=13735 RepID=UPI003F6D8804